MKTMITGVRPTGSITLANYIGGIKGFVEKQYPLADPGLGTQLYKDGLYVRVTNSLMAGIRFLVEIPQA